MEIMLEMNDDKQIPAYDISVLPELLPVYYQRLFPFKLFYKWICHRNESSFLQREFSFTLKDDVYLRFQSFHNVDQLEKEIKARNPYKIDIGAIYSSEPKNYRTSSNFLPVEKELVFDIDMTDYDDVRICCSGADICEKCWPFITIAMKIITRAMNEDFGFYHLLWVYSGRRGVHCWVCDDSARTISSRARSAIVEYLSVVKGGEYKAKKVHLGERIHPLIRSSLSIIKEYFNELILDKQDYLSTEKNCKKIISLCTNDIDSKLSAAIEQNIYKYDTSRERWEYLESTVSHHLSKEKFCKDKHYIEEVMLQLCYPRLDVNVTKQLNHLLKAPFCIHPKTGRVCVPIDYSKVDKFNPFSVPTITQLCEEINVYDKLNNDNIQEPLKKKDYEKTCLNASIEILKKFCLIVDARKPPKIKNEYEF